MWWRAIAGALVAGGLSLGLAAAATKPAAKPIDPFRGMQPMRIVIARDSEAGCEQVMHLLAGARGAMAGLMAEVVEDHVRTHLVDAEQHPGALNLAATEQLIEVVRTYLK